MLSMYDRFATEMEDSPYKEAICRTADDLFFGKVWARETLGGDFAPTNPEHVRLLETYLQHLSRNKGTGETSPPTKPALNFFDTHEGLKRIIIDGAELTMTQEQAEEFSRAVDNGHYPSRALCDYLFDIRCQEDGEYAWTDEALDAVGQDPDEAGDLPGISFRWGSHGPADYRAARFIQRGW